MTGQPANPAPGDAGDMLYATLVRLATLQREPVDRIALLDVVQDCAQAEDPRSTLAQLARQMAVAKPRWQDLPDAADLPAVIAYDDGNWALLRGLNAQGAWIVEQYNTDRRVWQERACPDEELSSASGFASLSLQSQRPARKSAVLQLILGEVRSHKSIVVETMIGGGLLALLGILVAFYSLQVYDRVIPTGATQTLAVLTLGVLGSLLFEFLVRMIRARLFSRLVDQIDRTVARAVYLRFLAVRLDQLPASVGTLASQLRGYESVRNFIITFTSQMAIDLPFSLLFVAVIALIAGPLALIPMAFFIIALPLGLWQARKLMELARRSNDYANQQTGLLVESVEGAEIIKSGQAGWRMLNRWLGITDASRSVSVATQHENDLHRHGTAGLQQLVYVLMIAAGALMASAGDLTMGGLLASSILSGRVLTPITQMGSLLASLANVKVALKGLDALWALEDDHHGQESPVFLDDLQGGFRFSDVSMKLGGNPVLNIPKLDIQPGEKVAIMGPIGAGKTTLLRLLSGMYKPTAGRIWLDNADLAIISKPVLAEHTGYLPQEGRLLAGTLRENLTLGILDPGDAVILEAAKTTGLLESVIATHPEGLQREIAEGGTGLSGGQRQLVNLTRVFLRKPRIWLLDEPTAAVDQELEIRLIAALKEAVRKNDTFVVVTHKPQVLALVDRIILVAQSRIVADGPRQKMLEMLTANSRPKPTGLVQTKTPEEAAT